MSALQAAAALGFGPASPLSLHGAGDGPAVICGAVRTLWRDLAVIGFEPSRERIFAVNLAGLHLPMEFAHWVSRHAPILEHARALRRVCTCAAKGPAGHSQEGGAGVDHRWELAGWSTDSGMLAARIALFMGFAPVYLCGVALDDAGHFYDPPGAGPGYVFDAERWAPYLDRLRFMTCPGATVAGLASKSRRLDSDAAMQRMMRHVR